jgi:hypothetical protein
MWEPSIHTLSYLAYYPMNAAVICTWGVPQTTGLKRRQHVFSLRLKLNWEPCEATVPYITTVWWLFCTSFVHSYTMLVLVLWLLNYSFVGVQSEHMYQWNGSWCKENVECMQSHVFYLSLLFGGNEIWAFEVYLLFSCSHRTPLWLIQETEIGDTCDYYSARQRNLTVHLLVLKARML